MIISPESLERSCPTCRFMDEPESPHQWHGCTWFDRPLPAAKLDVTVMRVNIEQPFTGCQTWEARCTA